MTSALLETRSLVLGYGKSDVVKGIDIDVPEGSVVTLIGANGAGKTSVLRALCGLLRPRAGTIRYCGEEIGGLAAHAIARRGIGHAPEGRQIFSRMTIAENLEIGGYVVTDRQELRRRREAILARFPRLAERLDQAAGQLSGGEQQMLAIGRALMADPRLLLLDEPSMGLAPLFVEQVFRIIADLKRDGRTILLVEQNAQAALDIADRAYVLESGRIALCGSAADVAANPDVVSAYLGGNRGERPKETS